MSLSPHIEDGFRAAAHDAERYWPGPDPMTPTRAEADEDMAEPMTVQPDDCGGCGVCLGCALRRHTHERRWKR